MKYRLKRKPDKMSGFSETAEKVANETGVSHATVFLKLLLLCLLDFDFLPMLAKPSICEQVKNQSAEFCALINNPQVEENKCAEFCTLKNKTQIEIKSGRMPTLNNKTQIEKKPADICVLKKNIKTGIKTRDIAAKKASPIGVYIGVRSSSI